MKLKNYIFNKWLDGNNYFGPISEFTSPCLGSLTCQSVDLSGMIFMKSGLSVGVRDLQTIDETKGFFPSEAC